MGIRIKREPFHKLEKIYRLTMAITFYAVLAVILSSAIIVPLFGSADANWVMILYSGFFFLYCLALVGCSVLSGLACYKTQSEILGLQCVLNIISFILAFLNYKLFYVLFLFGINKNSLAEKVVGPDSDIFVTDATSKWIYLILSVLISCILAVLSTVKLSKEKSHNK